MRIARLDPRLYQIASLALLLAYGMARLSFDITATGVAVIVGVSLLTQLAGTRFASLPRFDPRSALISALSLCLLLRTGSLAIMAAAAVIAISSKFLLRVHDKHLLNPTNGALVILLLLGDRAWVSPAQWGYAAFFAFLIACLGGLVVNRAARSDVTWVFLATYLALVFGRSLWLGEPMAIPAHRLASGALLLFAFFMISDPRTTPDSRAGRVLFGLLVAFGAWYVQFRLFRTNGLLWALFAMSFTTPLLDRLLPGPRFFWKTKGTNDENAVEARPPLHALPSGG